MTRAADSRETSSGSSGPIPTVSISVVIPTCGREQVLLATVESVLRLGALLPEFSELLVIDQSASHTDAVFSQLADWDAAGAIRWIRLAAPHLTQAMNVGLLRARSEVVLFLDDDVVPGPGLLANHLAAHSRQPAPAAVVGQVLQPGEVAIEVDYRPTGGPLRRFLDFPFNSTAGCHVENAMAGNLSVRRTTALALGGFDTRFTPPVASRFETEFAKRAIARRQLIWFEPSATIRHLRAPAGGTRQLGSHLSSSLPCFGMGDYYYALRIGRSLERLLYIARRPFREVRTRFHLKHPWFIPVKLIGEVRALMAAMRAYLSGPQMLTGEAAAAPPPGNAVPPRVESEASESGPVSS